MPFKCNSSCSIQKIVILECEVHVGKTNESGQIPTLLEFGLRITFPRPARLSDVESQILIFFFLATRDPVAGR